jgi:hypothetical protein
MVRIELLEEKLDNTRSLFQRIPLSLEYRRVARETYLITKVGPSYLHQRKSS